MEPRENRGNARIGVVGAGVSGLTAAHYLTRAGYRHVTVLEREPRVGGKCCSVTIGGRSYEMGAVIGTPDYTTTLELMRSVDLRTGSTTGGECYDQDGRHLALVPWYAYPHVLWLLAVNYAWLTRVKYRRINEPGLAGIHPDLYEPFGRFAQRHGLPSLEHALAPPFTAFGYGYFDQVPTAYVMKYLDLPTLDALRRPERRIVWPDGVQTLWERLAQQHDVRTGVTVRQVTRGAEVLVETDQGDLEFDALILTGPLDEARGILDCSPFEHRLFSAIGHYDYWVLLCEVTGLPEGCGYLPAHFTPDRAGHLMLWYQRWPGDSLYALYALGDFAMPQAVIEQTLAADLQRMGASLQRVAAVRRWKYFPHVGPTDMATGYYNTLEGMQGTRGTYYAGEVMSFASIEVCARYARALVARYFE
jgi:hypothetical protein